MADPGESHAGLYTIAEDKGIGARPGTLVAPPGSPPPRVAAYLYDADSFEEIAVEDMAQLTALRETGRNLWLDVNGLGDPEFVAAIGDAFGFHRLSLEDTLSLHQRPKVEEYDGYLFAVAQCPLTDGPQSFEQISVFIGPDYVVTFQAYEANRLVAVLNRVKNPATRVRNASSDYLAYAILDLIVDSYFPILADYDQRLEQIEADIRRDPARTDVDVLFEIKRALAQVRRHMWGTRDALTFLVREHHPVLRSDHDVYFRDIQDHAVRIIEFSEMTRETCNALTDYHLAQQGQRMNEVMKVLTIIATIFIPLTFIAGIYGMNFDPGASPWNMPELGWRYGYVAVWIAMLITVILMVAWFRRLGWLGAAGEDTRASEQE